MIANSYWRSSWGSFVKPNTGTFEILDVACLQEPSAQRIIHLYGISARCTGCDHRFNACDGQGLATVVGARLLCCPECGSRQAVANRDIARFVSRRAPRVERVVNEPVAPAALAAAGI